MSVLYSWYNNVNFTDSLIETLLNMKKLNINLIVVQLLCLMLCVYGTTKVFHIKQENDTTSADCPDPCVTLNGYAQNFSTAPFESVTLLFLPGEHTLTSTLAMENRVNSTLEATSTHVSIQCKEQGNLYFENIENLLLNEISFLLLSDANTFGISIINVAQAILSKVMVINSLSASGAVSISNSLVKMNDYVTFRNNTGPFVLSVSQSAVISEGLLEFVGNEVGTANGMQEVTSFISSSNFTVESFRFVRNQGSVYFFNSPFTVIKQLEVSENILIQDYLHTTFTLYGSSANWTGNILFLNNRAMLSGTAGFVSISQTVHIVGNLSVINNFADLHVGMQLILGSILQLTGTLVIKNNSVLMAAAGLSLISSAVLVDGSVHISENTASSMTSGVIVAQQNSIISVSGSFEFLNNKGVDGAFCVLFAFSTGIFNGQTLIQGSIANRAPHFFQDSDITFTGVSQIINNTVTDSYGGGIGLSQSVLRLEDSYFFENNQSPTGNGGAIYAIDSTINFSGTGNFVNNSAMNGGALQLFFQSRITLLTGVSLLFKQNRALTGGAIHVEEVVSFINCTNDIRLRFTYAEPPICFFDTSSAENVSLIFDSNEVTDGGSALYGGMLKRCIFSNQSGLSALDVFASISRFNESNTSLSSDAFQLCFCEGQKPRCDLEQTTVRVRRGEQFSVRVVSIK